jgi:hypothetical protein
MQPNKYAFGVTHGYTHGYFCIGDVLITNIQTGDVYNVTRHQGNRDEKYTVSGEGAKEKAHKAFDK